LGPRTTGSWPEWVTGTDPQRRWRDVARAHRMAGDRTAAGPSTPPRNADLRRRLQPPDSGSRRKWRKVVDSTVTYSPKHVGLATGLAGALASPNKLVSSGLVIVDWAYDNIATYIDRRMNKDDEDNAD